MNVHLATASLAVLDRWVGVPFQGPGLRLAVRQPELSGEPYVFLVECHRPYWKGKLKLRNRLTRHFMI